MEKFLQAALEASKKAELVIMKYFSDEVRSALKPDQTPVTIADQEAERIIIRTIKKHFPKHGFLGEETGEENPSEYTWIIDPIDGTKNYIRKLPFFGTQIALMRNGELILGVSNAPALKEIAYAIKGEGAFLNLKPIRVSNVSSLKDAFVCYGNIRYFDRQNCLDRLAKLAKDTFHAREYGDFWMYHLLAQGKIDVAIEAEDKIWDIAACKVIVEEAGGKVTQIDGKPLRKESTSIIATNGKIHDDVVKYFSK